MRLADLHYNYILRQSAQQGWQEALRTSGLSISTYRSRPRYKNARQQRQGEKASSPALPHGEKNERERLPSRFEGKPPLPCRTCPLAVLRYRLTIYGDLLADMGAGRS